MTSASTIADLRRRVAEATEADQELFEQLTRQLLPHNWWVEDNRIHRFIQAGAWTDAALALAEVLLPGQTVGPLTWQPSLKDPKGYARLGGGFVASEAPTLPLAILAALLNSLPADGRAA